MLAACAQQRRACCGCRTRRRRAGRRQAQQRRCYAAGAPASAGRCCTTSWRGAACRLTRCVCAVWCIVAMRCGHAAAADRCGSSSPRLRALLRPPRPSGGRARRAAGADAGMGTGPAPHRRTAAAPQVLPAAAAAGAVTVTSVEGLGRCDSPVVSNKLAHLENGGHSHAPHTPQPSQLQPHPGEREPRSRDQCHSFLDLSLPSAPRPRLPAPGVLATPRILGGRSWVGCSERGCGRRRTPPLLNPAAFALALFARCLLTGDARTPTHTPHSPPSSATWRPPRTSSTRRQRR